MNRPDMKAYFKARIDWHVWGMASTARARVPQGVVKVIGDVTDTTITAVMQDGTKWHWRGRRYSSVKRNGCYAPLMPKEVTL